MPSQTVLKLKPKAQFLNFSPGLLEYACINIVIVRYPQPQTQPTHYSQI